MRGKRLLEKRGDAGILKPEDVLDQLAERSKERVTSKNSGKWKKNLFALTKAEKCCRL